MFEVDFVSAINVAICGFLFRVSAEWSIFAIAIDWRISPSLIYSNHALKCLSKKNTKGGAL